MQRVLNLVAFTILLYWLRKYVLKLVAIEPFLTLGKASLEVFCAHVFFVFFGLALLYGDVTQLHGYTAIGLLAFTFSGLILVAIPKYAAATMKNCALPLAHPLKLRQRRLPPPADLQNDAPSQAAD